MVKPPKHDSPAFDRWALKQLRERKRMAKKGKSGGGKGKRGC